MIQQPLFHLQAKRQERQERESHGIRCVLTRASGCRGAAGRLGVYNGYVEASLAEALLPCVGDTLPGWEGLSVGGGERTTSSQGHGKP